MYFKRIFLGEYSWSILIPDEWKIQSLEMLKIKFCSGEKGVMKFPNKYKRLTYLQK